MAQLCEGHCGLNRGSNTCGLAFEAWREPGAEAEKDWSNQGSLPGGGGGFLGMKVGYELGDGETVRGIPINYFHGREKES